jgi:excisionase family DNA binding protein
MNKKNQLVENENLELLDVRQAAHFLNISVSTIRRWAQSNDLIGLKVGIRGDWRFTKVELLKMIKRKDGQPITNI